MQKIELQLPVREKDITQTLTFRNMSSWSGIILLNTALDEVEGSQHPHGWIKRPTTSGLGTERDRANPETLFFTCSVVDYFPTYY